jgi:hypothetical protein
MKNKYLPFLVVISILLLMAFSQIDAASPEITLKAGHVPTYHDIQYEWYFSEGTVPVKLSFTAPWDLTTGPKQKTITDILVKPEDAFDGIKFPGATFAFKRHGGTYDFYVKKNDGVYWMGSTAPPGHPNNPYSPHTYTPPLRQLIFPSIVGSQSVQTVLIIMPGFTKPLTMTVKIVGKGKVIVGAGTFNDAVLLQAKVAPTVGTAGFFVYQWNAPFVGVVAEIHSLDGELNELFTTAASFTWLKKCTMP